MTDISAALAQISNVSGAFLFLVFLRIGIIVSLLPVFGDQSIPVRVRLVCAFLFAVTTAQVIYDPEVAKPVTLSSKVLFSECFLGFLVGISIRMFTILIQITGVIAAQSTSLSQILGAQSIEPTPALGYLMTLSAATLAVTLDFHILIVSFLVNLYTAFPIGGPYRLHEMIVWALANVSTTFKLAVALSAPFLIVSALYNVTLGVINRAMPQLMVAFVGAPFITFAGLALLFLSLPYILLAWYSHYSSFLGGVSP